LNIGSLRKFKFILPLLNEQRRIVAYLDGLQAKVNALRELPSPEGSVELRMQRRCDASPEQSE